MNYIAVNIRIHVSVSRISQIFREAIKNGDMWIADLYEISDFNSLKNFHNDIYSNCTSLHSH